jgi:hypothetical protein
LVSLPHANVEVDEISPIVFPSMVAAVAGIRSRLVPAAGSVAETSLAAVPEAVTSTTL